MIEALGPWCAGGLLTQKPTLLPSWCGRRWGGLLCYLKLQVGWVLLLNPGDDLFGGLAGLGVLQDDEAPALSADGAGGEASGFEDVGDVVVADFLLGVEEFDGAAVLGGVEDELLDVLVLHGLYLS